MSDYTDILYSVDNEVATIAINRPHRLNAVTGHTTKELEAVLITAASDRSVGVIVLTGVGDRAFSAGGDLNWEEEGGLKAGDFNFNRLIVDCPKPVIARVDGYATGAGNHWAISATSRSSATKRSSLRTDPRWPGRPVATPLPISYM